MELYRLTAVEISAMLERREISSRELCGELAARTDEVEESVGAYITQTREKMLETADTADSRRASGGPVTKLTGIPAAIKDNICVEGVPMTCASRMLEGFVPPYSAHVAESMAAAAIPLSGKTNLDEFAMGSTCETSALQNTKNPHDLSRVPGGSSGGSAAALASGEVPLALGSDTGGSSRAPAAFCGVVGLKPTYGAVSRHGAAAFASSLDQIAPMARCIEDVALLADVVYSHDARDAMSSPEDVKKDGFFKNLSAGMSGKTIGLPEEYLSCVDGGVAEAVKSAAKTFESLGAKILPISLPMLRYAVETYMIISSAEASSNLAKFDGVKYGYRAEGAKDIFDLIRRSRTEALGEEVKRRIMLGTYVLSSGYYDAYYNKARAASLRIRAEFIKAFETCDVLMTPTTTGVAYKAGSIVHDPARMYAGDVLTVSVNIAGLPAISVPCGFSEGMPVGLQLIGRHFGEQEILNAAFAFERESGIKNIVADIGGTGR